MSGRLPLVVCAAVVANTARLRWRLRALATAPDTEQAVDPSHAFIAARGVRLTDAGRRAASAYARWEGLAVLDMVPADLPAERMLDLARMVNTATFRTSRFAPGRGAFQALLVDRERLASAGVKEREDYSETELVEITRRLKRYAATSMDLAVVPGLFAAPPERGDERPRARAEAYRYRRPLLAGPPLRTAALVGATAAHPPLGLATAALSALQPTAVSLGVSAARPADPRADIGWTTGRRLAEMPRLARSSTRRRRPGAGARESQAEAAERRARYQAEIAAGVERFLEPRRTTCPWCGSGRLAFLISSPDRVMYKPGTFRYDQCQACQHIFQNPRLTPEGLGFYYRDFYDGLHAEIVEELLGADATIYRARARLAARVARPRRWLDVGAGHGHFVLAAKEVLPRTRFDVLDMSDGIAEAARRGWADRVYRGMFPELAPKLAGQYDAVSMFHYLEHVREPYEELDAAVTALAPGGHLVIELPHAHGVGLKIFRSYWFPLFAPQHQHFYPPGNLTNALADRGLRTVALQVGEASTLPDAPNAAFLLMQRLQPTPDLPWLPYGPTPWRRVRRGLAMAAAVVPAGVGVAVETALAPYLRRGDRGNTYRIIARKGPAA